MVTIGKRIKEARLTKRWTQSELADRCGVSLRTIQRLEKDEVTASLYSSGKLVEVLGIEIFESTIQSENKSNHSKPKIPIMHYLSTISPFVLVGSLLIGLGYLGQDFLVKPKSPLPMISTNQIETTTINCGSDSECDIQVTLKNEKGEIIWEKKYGGTSYDRAVSVIPASDDGFLILGSTSSYGQGNYDILLIKVDTGGEVLWQKTYGGFFNEYAKSISPSENEKGYLIEGSQQECTTPNVSEDCIMKSWSFGIDEEGEKLG